LFVCLLAQTRSNKVQTFVRLFAQHASTIGQPFLYVSGNEFCLLGLMKNKLKNLTWRFAKTMPDIPHEYVVRSSENEADFVALFETINKHGRWSKFRGNRYRYWQPGDGFQYWTMTSDIRFSRLSRVINRAKIDGTEIADKITTAIIKYRRNKQLRAVWKRTPRDVRRVIVDRRWIFAWREGRTELIPLDELSDGEIAKRLPSSRRG
jgi:hypothetical protein